MKTTINEELDFAENAKFKVSKSNDFTYFNIDENNQIRIIKTGSKYNKSYRVTLNHVDNEIGVYSSKIYSRNEHACNLKEAKLIAGKIYFEQIRK